MDAPHGLWLNAYRKSLTGNCIRMLRSPEDSFTRMCRYWTSGWKLSTTARYRHRIYSSRTCRKLWMTEVSGERARHDDDDDDDDHDDDYSDDISIILVSFLLQKTDFLSNMLSPELFLPESALSFHFMDGCFNSRSLWQIHVQRICKYFTVKNMFLSIHRSFFGKFSHSLQFSAIKSVMINFFLSRDYSFAYIFARLKKNLPYKPILNNKGFTFMEKIQEKKFCFFKRYVVYWITPATRHTHTHTHNTHTHHTHTHTHTFISLYVYI